MGIFANILKKLGLGRDEPKLDVRPYGPKKTIPGVGPGGGGGGGGGAVATPDKPVAISEVDVVAQLEKRAADNPQKLNWRTSIVDLLKLLDMDSSLDERKALAKELGAPASVMDNSSEMNIWLHKEVLKQVAANGGNVPANLLD
jgi:hypothetical protein